MQKIVAGVYFFGPVRRIFLAGVVGLYFIEMGLDVGPRRRIDIYDRIDAGVHGFLDERRMEVAGIQGNETDGSLPLADYPAADEKGTDAGGDKPIVV